jgi:holo-[acyl-carrier protein] synthase
MAIRVGIDLLSPDEVQESVIAHGECYLKRVYTAEELRDCGHDARRLAGRFAAKEATMKALCRGDEPLSWPSIGVRRDQNGSLLLRLTGAAGELARRRGARELSLSLTERDSLVMAVVLAKLDGCR